MLKKILERTSRHLRSDGGNMLVLGAILITAVVGVGGVAIDYNRAASMQRKLQTSADIAVKEAVRGKTDAEVKNLVYGQLDGYMREMGYTDAQQRVTVNVKRSGDGVTLDVSGNYDSLFGKLYGQQHQVLNVSTGAQARSFCQPASPNNRWVNATDTCAAGFLGSITYQREEQQISTCPNETGAPVFGSWTATGNTRNRVDSCKKQCVVPAAQTQWVDRLAACPTNQVGTNSWQAEQRRTSYCPSTTAAPAWNGWADTGARRNESNSCVAPPKWEITASDKRVNWIPCPEGNIVLYPTCNNNPYCTRGSYCAVQKGRYCNQQQRVGFVVLDEYVCR